MKRISPEAYDEIHAAAREMAYSQVGTSLITRSKTDAPKVQASSVAKDFYQAFNGLAGISAEGTVDYPPFPEDGEQQEKMTIWGAMHRMCADRGIELQPEDGEFVAMVCHRIGAIRQSKADFGCDTWTLERSKL